MRQILFTFMLALFMLGCGGSDSTESANVSDNTQQEEDAPSEVSAKNWYVRLVVKDHGRGIESRSATMGELEDAEMVAEQQLGRLEPFSGGYIDIAFKNPSGLPNGEYKSYFQQHIEDGTKTWNFTVLCDDPQATVTLKWRGFYVLTPYQDENNQTKYREHISRSNPLVLKMQLVDVVTGRSIPVVRSGQIGMMSFNMGGSTSRDFRWELLNVDAVEVVVDEKASSSSSIQRAPSRSMKSNTTETSRKVDFSQPPGFKKR